jgi:hypothetical protein
MSQLLAAVGMISDVLLRLKETPTFEGLLNVSA